MLMDEEQLKSSTSEQFENIFLGSSKSTVRQECEVSATETLANTKLEVINILHFTKHRKFLIKIMNFCDQDL